MPFPSAARSALDFGPFTLDREQGLLTRAGAPVALRRKCWDVLVFLVDSGGSLVSNEVLQSAVWAGVAVTPKTLTNVVAELRGALGDDPDHPTFIETVHRRGYRFIAEAHKRAIDPRLASATSPAMAKPAAVPLIGREVELQALATCWHRALAGEPQVAIVTGEAGIGKSQLIDAFRDVCASTPDSVLVGRGQCIERHGGHEAYMPVLDIISTWAAGDSADVVTDLLGRYAPTWLAQIPWLVPAPRREVLALNTNSGRMLREGTRFFEALAEYRPIVLLLEDLHWSDLETIDFLSAMAQRTPGTRILSVGSYRTVEARLVSHPIANVAGTLRRAGSTHLVLEPFTEVEVTRYLEQRFADRDLAARAALVVEEHSRGIPLFVRAVVDQMEARGWITSAGGAFSMEDQSSFLRNLPLSVREVIDDQLDLLEADVREVLEVAAVAGGEFSVDEVAHGAEISRESVATIFDNLNHHGWLVRRVESKDSKRPAVERYGFVHSLYQRALYQHIQDYRCRRLHQRLGELLESMNAEGRHAAALAAHFERSGDHSRAARYCESAAYLVSQRAASRQVIAYFSRAREHLAFLPPDPEHELRLLVALGEVATHTFGPQSELVAGTVDRALELCSEVDNPATLYGALHGLWLYSLLSGDSAATAQLVARVAMLASQHRDQKLTVLSDFMSGTALAFVGLPEMARECLERAYRVTSAWDAALPRTILDIRVEVAVTLGWVYWSVGRPDTSLELAAAAVAAADVGDDPNSTAYARIFLYNVHYLRGEIELARQQAVQIQAIGEEFDLELSKQVGLALESVALLEKGDVDAAFERIVRSGMSEVTPGLQQVLRTVFLGRLALACGRLGFPEQGLDLVDDALARIAQTGSATSVAETHRIRGELVQLIDSATLHRRGMAADAGADPRQVADACFATAIELARGQGARAWEFRATVSRCRLWHRQGRGAEALAVLAEFYRGFSEGFDTVDLREARALIDKLSA